MPREHEKKPVDAAAGNDDASRQRKLSVQIRDLEAEDDVQGGVTLGGTRPLGKSPLRADAVASW